MGGRAFFEQLADALVGFLPPDLRGCSMYRTSGNLKVWYGEARGEHYEAQFVSGRALKAAGRGERGPALEIGFHAEHKDRDANALAVAVLEERREAWRDRLGDEPEADGFIGNAVWRRLSELWTDDGVLEAETAIEAAERLAAYIECFEPIRRARR